MDRFVAGFRLSVSKPSCKQFALIGTPEIIFSVNVNSMSDHRETRHAIRDQ